jgi:hypothetical protein
VFGWDYMVTSFQTINPPDDLTDDEKEKIAKDNLKILKEAVENGTLKKGNNIDLTGILEKNEDETLSNLLEDAESRQPGAIQKEITDALGENKAYIVNGMTPNENEVILNGQKISELKNVTEAHFDTEGKYFYYSKYSVDENSNSTLNNLQSSDKIYRWDIHEEKEEEFYDFGDIAYISFKANQEKLIYILMNDFLESDIEIGVLDLETKEKEVVDYDFEGIDSNVNTDTEYIPYSVVDIGQETALIEVNPDDGYGKYFRLNLKTLKLAKI